MKTFRTQAGPFPEQPYFEERELEAGQFGAVGIAIDEAQGQAEEAIMRVAFGQKAEVIADELAEIEPGAVLDQGGGAGLEEFDREHAELVFEAGAPGELDGIARLEGGGKAPGATTADEAEMTATAGDHGLGND